MTRGFVLLSVAITFAAALFYHPQSHALNTADGLAILGGVVMGLALLRARAARIPPLVMSPVSNVDTVSPEWRWIAAGAVCLLLVAERNADVLNIRFWYDVFNIHVQMLLLIGGSVLLVIGGFGGMASVRGIRVDFTGGRALLPLAAITALAFGLRMWQLQDAIRASMDEMPFVAAIVEMQEKPYGILMAPVGGIPTFTRVYPYGQLLISAVLGGSFGSLRLLSVIFGTLTVPALYLLARWLFDRPTALLAALLLATFPPHIHVSHIGINNIADPFFGTLALGFAVRGLQMRQRGYFVLAGVMLGWLAYFYEGGKLLYPVLLLGWLLWMALGGARIQRRGVLLLIGISLLVAFPALYTTIAEQRPFFSRLTSSMSGDEYWDGVLTSETGLAQVQAFFRERMMPPLLHYIHAPDGSIFYGGETPLILSFLVPAFLLGVYHALWRLGTTGMLLILWVLLTALGNSLIPDTAWTIRFVVAIPGVVLLLAVGMRYTAVMLVTHWTPFARALARVIVAIVIVAQVVYYYGPHLMVYQDQIARLKEHYDVIFRMRDLPDDTVVIFAYNDHMQAYFTPSLLDYLDEEIDYRPVVYDGFLLEMADFNDSQTYAFFLDDEIYIDFIKKYWDVDGPYASPYDLPPDRQFSLYFGRPENWKSQPAGQTEESAPEATE